MSPNGAETLFVPPRLRHRLSVALQFNDVFTGEAVRLPLDVRIEAADWTPYRGERDATYRFFRTNDEVEPSGALAVSVAAPGGEYRSFEPVAVSLPLPAPPTPVQRGHFLVQAPLWPTRALRPPHGETAVVGRIESSGGVSDPAGLRVFLFDPPPPPPPSPYAYSDEAGDFLFRLPRLRGSVSGGMAVTQATLAVAVRRGATPVPVNPATVNVPLGRISVVELTVP